MCRKILLTVDQVVDLRIPTPWQPLTSYPLIVQVVEGGVYIGAKHKYFGFVRVETVPRPCAILGYNVDHRLQVFTGGDNKGEIVCIHWSSTEYAANSHTESRMFKFH